MKATQLLHNLGQSIWLDNITRDLLDNGTLKRYIDELSVTGLTSNPTIFENAIKNSRSYDAPIRERLANGKSGEELFFELALEDITRQPTCSGRSTTGRTRWTAGCRWRCRRCWPTTRQHATRRQRSICPGKQPNSFIKIPGTKEGLPAIEESIFAGVPVNVTLLFSREHYLAAAEAFLRGIERRLKRGSTRTSVRWRRFSSAAGTPRSPTRYPPLCATNLVSQSLCERTKQLAICLVRRDGIGFTTPAPARSVFFGRAREPRIPRLRTSCTSKRSLLRSP